jgi:DNA invertase Pin-like site-specific DNA recombinase
VLIFFLTPANTATRRYKASISSMTKTASFDFSKVPRALNAQLEDAIAEYAQHTGKERQKRAAAAAKSFKKDLKAYKFKIKGDFLTVRF